MDSGPLARGHCPKAIKEICSSGVPVLQLHGRLYKLEAVGLLLIGREEWGLLPSVPSWQKGPTLCTNILCTPSFVREDFQHYRVDLTHMAMRPACALPISVVISSLTAGTRTILHAARCVGRRVFPAGHSNPSFLLSP